MHRHRTTVLSVALLLAGTSVAFAQTGSSGGTSGGGTSGVSSGTTGGVTSPGATTLRGTTTPGIGTTQPSGGVMGPTVRAPSSNPSAVQSPTVTTQPQSNPSAAQPPAVALPSTRPGCNPSQQAGGPSIAGTGSIGTASITGGGVTARQDNQVDNRFGSGSPQTPTSNPQTPASADGIATAMPGTTGARSGGSIDTGTPRIANDPSLGTGRTVQTNPGSVGISSVTGTPGTPSAETPTASVGSATPSAAPGSGSVATGC